MECSAVTDAGTTTSTAGERPYVVNVQGAEPSTSVPATATQSTEWSPSSAVTHGSVVGAGGSTPQRRTTGSRRSPQAAVAWPPAVTLGIPASSAGRASTTSAHSGSAACGAAVTGTALAHAATVARRSAAGAHELGAADRATTTTLAPDTVAVVEPHVADLDEDALLELVFPLLPRGVGTLLGPGDDAAVVTAGDGRVVVSTDLLEEGRHFRTEWSSGSDVGWRAAMANLADIAAMGARPTAVVVGLVLPGTTPVAWVTDLAAGLADACAPHGVGVVGGDLSGGDQIMVSVTVLGDLGGREPVRRDGARPGDVVGHAGVCGHSAAGLAALGGGIGDHETAIPLVLSYLRPEPPLAAGTAATRQGVTAMLDVSDGLLRDAGRMASASGVVLDLDTGALAADLAVVAPVARILGADPWVWLLSGGEDHGLLATFPTPVAPFRTLGRVLAPNGHPAGTVLLDGEVHRVGTSGWDHFAG